MRNKFICLCSALLKKNGRVQLDTVWCFHVVGRGLKKRKTQCVQHKQYKMEHSIFTQQRRIDLIIRNSGTFNSLHNF